MSSNPDDAPYPTWPPSPALDSQLSEMRQLIVTWSELLQHILRDASAIERRLYGLQLAYNNAAEYAILRMLAVKLSRREHEVLLLAARGLKNREIGLELGIGAGTVKNHMTGVLTKLHVHNRRQAVAMAQALGII